MKSTPSVTLPVIQANLERRRNAAAIGEEITELAAHIHAATFLLLEKIREFDCLDGWKLDGVHSCAHWLQWQCGMNLGAAREKVRVAKALAELPKISESFSEGRISYSKVRAMTRVATPKNEKFLLGIARHGTAAHVEKVVSNYRQGKRLETLQTENRRQVQRELTWFVDDDGMWVLKGRFTAEQGALIKNALARAMNELFEEQRNEPEDVSAETSTDVDPIVEKPHPVATRRADALERVAEAFLSGNTGVRSGGDRYLINIHTEADALTRDGETAESECEDCGNVSAETSRRMACDAAVVHWREGADGEPLNIGRKTRTIPPAIRRALQRRDQGCRFPGCTCSRFVDAHHVRHWADGGETRMDNLVLLCRRHHRLVHEGGFGVTTHPDGEIGFTYPDGRVLPPAPDGRFRGNADSIQVLNRQNGLDIKPQTLPPLWRGERMDEDLAQLAMQSRE
jgi:5-methylcytosine-specific restriction endonuclease McrA